MKLSLIAKHIQALMHGKDSEFTKVTIDSRKIMKGDCFVAIKGEKFDGHDFIAQAIEKGATAIVASRAPLNDFEKTVSFLEVEDTIAALGRWGAFWRDQVNIPVIGITGSCGKTTVKGMIEAICQQAGKTLATEGNFNNHIGLPLTLLRLNESYRYAVIEMGASAKGEIQYLGQIAKPNIALITNVAPAHLEGFGSIEGVSKAKSEIYDILPRNGIAILNTDESFCDSWCLVINGRKTVTFGLNHQAMIRATDIRFSPMSTEFTLHAENQTIEVSIPIPGKHTVMNVLASASAAVAAGISLKDIAHALATFKGVKGRLCRYIGLKGSCVIDDSYNANPRSVDAALDVLAACKGEKVFVMGDMAELGVDVARYHINVGELAKAKGISKLLAVGKFCELTVRAFGSGAKWYPTKEALLDDLKGKMHSETVVLVKGSRSAQMDMVTKAIVQNEE